MSLSHLSTGDKVTAGEHWNPLVDAVNTNETGIAQANSRIDALDNTSLQDQITSNSTNIATNAAGVNALNTAVGMPYNDADSLSARLAALEAANQSVTQPFGHAGRTAGFQSTASGILVGVSAQVLEGGMTFASSGLVVPSAGRYLIITKGYWTGGTNGTANWGTRVNNSAVPTDFGSSCTEGALYFHKDTTTDDWTSHASVTARLNAGDVVYLFAKYGSSTWGTDGYNGMWFEVLRVGP